jgi:RNA recognition motif-containing protein
LGYSFNSSDRHPSVASITTGACFIKSVNENIDEKTLKEQLLKKFGPIKELDIVRNKACGFLEFERIDSAKKAIQMSMPFNMGGKGGIPIVLASGEEYVINVESKRQPGERGRPVDAGPKRGFSDRGGRPGANNFGPSGSRGGRGGMDNGPRVAGRGGANTPRGGAGGRNLTNSK